MSDEQDNVQSYTCPLPHQRRDTVVLGHGSGGKLSHELLEQVFLPELGNAAPRILDDSAGLGQISGRLAITTDAHVVSPLFFPGGDIGRLAVCGTVNDLAMVGANPLALTSAFIIEEGLSFETLKTIARSMHAAAAEAGTYIAAGDTKVVQRGAVDQLFITTSGIGVIPEGLEISGSLAKPGDVIIISGTIGDHGIAVLSKRADLGFETELRSDVAPLNHLVSEMLAAGTVHVLRDPTRGGLGTSLVEISRQSSVTMEVQEWKIPMKSPVRAACEMLGFDPLHIANEGKLIAILPEADASKILTAMHSNPYGAEAVIIGKVTSSGTAQVRMKTQIGGTRLIEMLPGEMLPRIC